MTNSLALARPWPALLCELGTEVGALAMKGLACWPPCANMSGSGARTMPWEAGEVAANALRLMTTAPLPPDPDSLAGSDAGAAVGAGTDEARAGAGCASAANGSSPVAAGIGAAVRSEKAGEGSRSGAAAVAPGGPTGSDALWKVGGLVGELGLPGPASATPMKALYGGGLPGEEAHAVEAGMEAVVGGSVAAELRVAAAAAGAAAAPPSRRRPPSEDAMAAFTRISLRRLGPPRRAAASVRSRRLGSALAERAERSAPAPASEAPSSPGNASKEMGASSSIWGRQVTHQWAVGHNFLGTDPDLLPPAYRDCHNFFSLLSPPTFTHTCTCFRLRMRAAVAVTASAPLPASASLSFAAPL